MNGTSMTDSAVQNKSLADFFLTEPEIEDSFEKTAGLFKQILGLDRLFLFIHFPGHGSRIFCGEEDPILLSLFTRLMGSKKDCLEPDELKALMTGAEMLSLSPESSVFLKLRGETGAAGGMWAWTPGGSGFSEEQKEGLKLLQAVLERMLKHFARSIRMQDAASQAKRDFLSRMSHEIRTPINAVLGMAQIGQKSDDVDKMRGCFKRIEESSHQLMRIVGDILDISRLESNQIVLHNERFDFRCMLAKLKALILEEAADRRQIIEFHIDDRIPVFFIGDEMRVRQIFVSLISNAMKFSPPGGRILFRLLLKKHSFSDYIIEGSVTDQGIGISKGQQELIFQSFEQADGSHKRKYGGTGLGLAITKRLVELMHGKINVLSKEGEGSTFICTIHLKACQEEADYKKQGWERGPNPAAAKDVRKNIKESGTEDMAAEKDLMEMEGIEELLAYIDIEDGLKRVRGNKAIFKTLLKSFLGKDYLGGLLKEIEAGNMENAAKEAHALKGVSANLSLKKLNEVVVALESNLKNNYPFDNSLEELKAVVDETLKQIHILIDKL